MAEPTLPPALTKARARNASGCAQQFFGVRKAVDPVGESAPAVWCLTRIRRVVAPQRSEDLKAFQFLRTTPQECLVAAERDAGATQEGRMLWPLRNDSCRMVGVIHADEVMKVYPER